MISVRKIAVSELIILTKLIRYNNVNAMIAENSDLILTGEADIFCIFKDDESIGMLHVRYFSRDEMFAVKGVRAYLFSFQIQKALRGKGYGKQLIRKVIDTLKSEGYTEFTIGARNDNLRAKHIYESLGFTKVITIKTEKHRDREFFYNLYLKS